MPPKLDTHIQSLPATIPFVAPERISRETGKAFVARIGANEGRFGCSPLAIEAMQKAAIDNVGVYGDPEAYAVRETIGSALGVSIDEITIGSGIDGLLGHIVRIFSAPGDDILTSLGAYPTFNYHVAAYGRQLHTVPYRNDYEDLDGLVEVAKNLRPAILYLANPDNPMGSWWPAEKIDQFIDAISEDTLIILDEAYGETAPEGTLPALNCDKPNVLRMRTFSKAYGLAGLRCGYAIGHRDLIAQFEKIRDHFGVNIMALVAADAAFKDQAWLQKAVALNQAATARISQIALTHGFIPLPTATNFVAIDCGQGADFAKQILVSLADHGIFIRKPMTPILDRCIRVSAGNSSELDAFEAAMNMIMKDLK